MNRNISALILVVLAIAIYFTYTQGQIDTNAAISAQNDQYAIAIKNSQTLTGVRDSIQTQYNDISLGERNSLDRMIPSSVDNIHLIVDVSRLANRTGFALRNIKADVVQAPSSVTAPAASASNANPSLLPNVDVLLGSVKLSFEATASYTKFISFMQAFESSLRVMDVTKLNVKANDTGTYDFSVELNAYWVK